ncbi:hypothetical protein FQN57_004690 [Myotisia sp. PD_48]|nr:hypothetical protein FQN57_004690 [Myotisia sp. PD_48]
MHLRKSGFLALAAVAQSIHAFRDTSPFFFFSNHQFETSSQQIQSAASILDDVSEKLLSCPSDYYLIVSQPGVHALDYSSQRSAPQLRSRLLKKSREIRSSYMISEVVGEIDTTSLQSRLESKCGAKTITIDGASETIPSSYSQRPQIINITFPKLPVDVTRANQLVENDALLAMVIHSIESSNYTVVYTTTPRGSEPIEDATSYEHEMDPNQFQHPIQSKLKRDFHSHTGRDTRDDGGHNSTDKRALFEKYQFLSPGIFMGLMATIILGSILYAGLSALGSLKISYSSFDKENGPAAAAKKQQ